ncbi:hypothetical protein EYF80_014235 [Liparis tanakae]|uniref:Uncharacterized protein n=1 Tax=Liparis tanakae TaxID=230148 RepID=A0A4Z2IEG2_9TELE|nr:hypothetical protein EYF80_014235 [Liparis tanakae]
MPEREGAPHTQRGSEAPDWSGGEGWFRGQRAAREFCETFTGERGSSNERVFCSWTGQRSVQIQQRMSFIGGTICSGESSIGAGNLGSSASLPQRAAWVCSASEGTGAIINNINKAVKTNTIPLKVRLDADGRNISVTKILLVCLVQAEHVRCVWAAQAQNSNRNSYVGFTQQGGGYGGGDPRTGLRRASGSPGSARGGGLYAHTVDSSSRQRFPTSGNRQIISQPAKSVYDPVTLVQSSAESKPNRPASMLRRVNVQKMPQKSLSASSASIASGGSLSKYAQSPTGEATTWPVQSRGASAHWSSGSESLPGPRGSSSSTPSSRQTSVNSATPKSSRPGAAEPRRIPVRTKTSASTAARRVSSRRGSAPSTHSRFSSLQNKSARNNPGRIGAWEPFSSRVGPASGASGQGFAPSTTHRIPERFGGYAIRRLRGPAGVGKPSQHWAYAAQRRPSPLQKLAYVASRRPSSQQKPAYVAPWRPSRQQDYALPSAS